jgi:hypothetical protein
VCRSGELGPCHQLWLRADSRQIVDGDRPRATAISLCVMPCTKQFSITVRSPKPSL